MSNNGVGGDGPLATDGQSAGFRGLVPDESTHRIPAGDGAADKEDVLMKDAAEDAAVSPNLPQQTQEPGDLARLQHSEAMSSDTGAPTTTNPATTTANGPASTLDNVRQWMDDCVTPDLLDGMRHIATTRPADPLKVLGEFLLARAADKRVAS
ncbi:MAG: hypothetical protein M1814_001879 [Vezdaea aestivalis]|nr:MAG: hypothetical protein M1814_001879 [Vezdaea aestivalis]